MSWSTFQSIPSNGKYQLLLFVTYSLLNICSRPAESTGLLGCEAGTFQQYSFERTPSPPLCHMPRQLLVPFSFHVNGTLSWNQAQARCVSHGGNLASITSMSDNVLAVECISSYLESDLPAQDYFIGYTYGAPATWSDGKSFSYNNHCRGGNGTCPSWNTASQVPLVTRNTICVTLWCTENCFDFIASLYDSPRATLSHVKKCEPLIIHPP